MTTQVKICGLSTLETLHVALDAGADYVGLVFFPASPRNVDLAMARRLAEAARGRAKIVALLVDPTDAVLADVVAEISPDLIQLHGSETADRVTEVRALSGRPVMKAVKIETSDDARSALDLGTAADLILFDAKAPKGSVLPGGNGVAFDWTVLGAIPPGFPYMLSGGLTPENVAEAITTTGARAVDVSSGVESRPGVKDPERIRSFLRAAKAANETAEPAQMHRG
jgi:phosphoribosylanthranilate isomerase